MPAWITEGAVPLMAIHSCSDKKNLKLTAAMVKGIYEGGVDGYSPSGIKVVVDQSGSMSTRTFPIWCRHFVENLPDGQGPGGEHVILFLDGHGSRWSYEGLSYLRENNVIVFCLPAHTSIWAQVRIPI